MLFDKVPLSKMNCLLLGSGVKKTYRKLLIEEEKETKNVYCQIQADILNKMQFTGESTEVSIKNIIVSIFQSLLSLREYLTQLADENLFVNFQDSENNEFLNESLNKLFPYNNSLLLSLLDDNIHKTYAHELNKFKHPNFNSNIFIRLDILFKKLEWIVTSDTLALWHKKLKEMQWIQIRYLAIYSKLEKNIRFICEKSHYTVENLRNWKLQILRLLFTQTREHPDFKKNRSCASLYFSDLSSIRASLNDPTFCIGFTTNNLFNKQIQSLTRVKTQMEEKDLPDINEQDFSTACREGNLEKIKKIFQEHGVIISAKDFFEACALGHHKIVSLLCAKYSVSRHAREVMNTFHNDKTPLMIAAENKHVKVVKILLKQKDVKVGLSNRSGHTALTLCADGDICKMIAAFLPAKMQAYHSKESSSLDVKISSTVPDETGREFQDLVTYFSMARKNEFNEIKSMLITCAELSSKFEMDNHDINTQKIFEKFTGLKNSFEYQQNELKRIYEFTSKKHLSSQKYLNQYRKLRKKHGKIIKKIAIIKSDVSKIKNQLESTVNHLKKSQINIIHEPKNEHKKEIKSEYKPKSKVQVQFPLISDNHDSKLEVLNNSIFEEKKNSENYWQFFQPALPQINNFFGLLTASDYYYFINDDIVNAKILAIRNYCQYDLSKLSDSKQSPFERSIMMNLQIDAILFEVMQLMGKGNQPLIRDAIVHCKGIIELDLSYNNLDNFHRDVMNLAENLMLSINDMIKFLLFLQIENYSRPQKNSFYKKLMSHGVQLQIQKSTGKRQQVTPDERCHYTMTLANKRFLYETINLSKLGIYCEEMQSSALRLVNIHAHVYGLLNNLEINANAAREDRHFSYNLSF